MIAEGDLKSLEQLRNRNDKTGVYNPDYISSSKQIHFYEEDNDDSTWVYFIFMFSCRFVFLDIILRMSISY